MTIGWKDFTLGMKYVDLFVLVRTASLPAFQHPDSLSIYIITIQFYKNWAAGLITYSTENHLLPQKTALVSAANHAGIKV